MEETSKWVQAGLGCLILAGQNVSKVNQQFNIFQSLYFIIILYIIYIILFILVGELIYIVVSQYRTGNGLHIWVSVMQGELPVLAGLNWSSSLKSVQNNSKTTQQNRLRWLDTTSKPFQGGLRCFILTGQNVLF